MSRIDHSPSVSQAIARARSEAEQYSMGRLKGLTDKCADPVAPLLFTEDCYLLYISAMFFQNLNVIPVGARLASGEILDDHV